MRILITNDDGINAPGLAILEGIAAHLAGDDSEIWTVAPALEQSGVGHCISYVKPMMITKLAPRRYSVEGTPADCVLAGICEVMPSAPDLILSGVNRGNNAGENTLYSGTIGAALEGALHGIRSVALSQYFGPDNAKLDDPFEAAGQLAAPLLASLLENGIWQDQPYGVFYNINFPPIAAKLVKGNKVVAQGFRGNGGFSVEPHQSPSGRKFLWVKGGTQHEPTAPDTDVHANLDGYISVTPMRADLTAHDVLAKVTSAIS
ncbi:MAG: 5'/3'-nucleotidase SurE [Alphaproteobacteria bacterium]|nr:5'/3'-nucleotidase SurE [Alphaproteobacteria bacterium]